MKVVVEVENLAPLRLKATFSDAYDDEIEPVVGEPDYVAAAIRTRILEDLDRRGILGMAEHPKCPVCRGELNADGRGGFVAHDHTDDSPEIPDWALDRPRGDY